MSPDNHSLLRELEEIATREDTDQDLRTLARAVLLLVTHMVQGRENNMEAFDQIEELSKRQSAK